MSYNLFKNKDTHKSFASKSYKCVYKCAYVYMNRIWH